MLRHAEMIRLSIMLLERVGYDVSAAGGPAYCCGTAHDHQPHGASNMAARTVGRFNEAAEKEGRGTVVTWCPSCHMHMSDIMSPGNAAAFEIAHITELLADRAERLAPLLQVPVKRRVLLHRHLGFATHVPSTIAWRDCFRAFQACSWSPGPAHPGHMCSALAAVPGALAKAARETWDAAARAAATRFAPYSTRATASWRRSTARTAFSVRNWVQLVAEAMGLEASDAYLGWRTGGAPDIAAIGKADKSRYHSSRRAGAAQAAPGLAALRPVTDAVGMR